VRTGYAIIEVMWGSTESIRTMRPAAWVDGSDEPSSAAPATRVIAVK
jgi:hypothetical protein